MIDPMTGRPAYQQLADLLRAGISSGQYPPRTPLPSAKTLSQQHGIAVNTVMKRGRPARPRLARTVIFTPFLNFSFPLLTPLSLATFSLF